MKEIWKDVKGYEGYYQVSNLGRVKRLKVLKSRVNKNGYRLVNLYKNSKGRTFYVHILVAKNFIDHNYLEKKLHCNHIDGVKINNTLSNLEVVTRSENEKHAFRIGLKSHKGDRHNRRKLSSIDVANIRRMLSEGVKPIFLAEKYNVSACNISNIKHFRSWN